MRIMAIIPGPIESSWLIWDGTNVVDFGEEPNDAVLSRVRGCGADEISDDHLVIRMPNFGLILDPSVLEVAFWSGKFSQAFYSETVHRITPRQINHRRPIGETLAVALTWWDENAGAK